MFRLSGEGKSSGCLEGRPRLGFRGSGFRGLGFRVYVGYKI